MCGISVVLSKKNNSINMVINSLKQLQNRGYDSFGIGTFINDKMLVKKQVGISEQKNVNREKIETNENIIDKDINKDIFDLFCDKINGWKSNLAIGHTRWATHGGVNIDNSHPHISNNRDICLVHNGIIENYVELKNLLLEKQFTFYSETDSEVIVNLIEYFYKENEEIHKKENEEIHKKENNDINNDFITSNIIKSIKQTINKLEGTYGLAIMFSKFQDNIYVVRNGSPILIGENDEYIMATSEASGFVNQIKNYYAIDNDNIVTLSLTKGIINNTNMDIIENKNFELELTPDPYDHWTLKEIMEQPKSLLRSTNNGARIHNNSIKLGGLEYLKMHIHSIENIIFLGCGTSLNACEIGCLFVKSTKCINYVSCFDAAEFCLNDLPLNGKTLLVMCTQSGETKDLHRVLGLIKEETKIITMGIVNVVDSLIAREVDCGIYMNAGREVAVASTKSFTSTLMLLRLFSFWILENCRKNYISNPITYNNLRKITDQVNSILINRDTLIQNNHLTMINKQNIFILGKDKMKYIANEMALKMKEICYIHAEGYSAAALKHGPFALLQEGFPVILLMNKENESKMLNVYKEIESRKANILVISEINNLETLGIIKENTIIVPENRELQEIIYIAVLQLICYKLALLRNINPDKPRNLAKVVTVE